MLGQLAGLEEIRGRARFALRVIPSATRARAAPISAASDCRNVVLKEDGLTERETTRLCPDCEEEYLIEVREPGVRIPVEVYCPACGYTEDVDPEEEYGEEEEAA